MVPHPSSQRRTSTGKQRKTCGNWKNGKSLLSTAGLFETLAKVAEKRQQKAAAEKAISPIGSAVEGEG